MSGLFGRLGGIAVLAAVTVWGAGPATAERSATYTIGPSVNVSSACKVQNAEVEQAVDVRLGYVYEMWMGCKGIGFARSTNGGKSFGAPVSLPGPGSTNSPWDPALAVGPTGTVYASFMVNSGGKTFPIVDASTDHGAAFKHVGSLIPSVSANWATATSSPPRRTARWTSPGTTARAPPRSPSSARRPAAARSPPATSTRWCRGRPTAAGPGAR